MTTSFRHIDTLGAATGIDCVLFSVVHKDRVVRAFIDADAASNAIGKNAVRHLGKSFGLELVLLYQCI